jgi:hypothetical protein
MEINKTEVMQFRVSPREKVLIEKCAKKEGMTVSDYVRSCMLMEMIIDGEGEALKIVMATLGRKGIEGMKRKLKFAESAAGKA